MSSGVGPSGSPAPCAGAVMGSLGHPICLIKEGLHLDLQFVSLFVQEGAVILCEFNED